MTKVTDVGFADLLSILGFTDSEYVSVCHQAGAGPFLTDVCSPQDAPGFVATLPATANVYFGVCPIQGPARSNSGRGKAANVTRLSALWVDLDVAPGKCPTREVADVVIDDLSVALMCRPAAITETGHGLHPYWPVIDGALGSGFTRETAELVLRRWKSLVFATASRNGAKVDSVFDLARVLRVPGSYNNKETE